MPRIFKGSESTLRLLLHTCTQEGAISELKIALFTNDPSVAVEFTDRYTIDGCFVNIVVPNYAFGNMEDGVINYRAEGMIDDDTFITERQSNYFLKTPSNYTPIEIPKEVKLEKLKETINKTGVYKYLPSEGYEGFSSVEISSYRDSNYYSVDEAIAKLDENPSKVFHELVVLGYVRNITRTIHSGLVLIHFDLYGENDRYIDILELRENEVPSSLEEGDIVVLFGTLYDYRMVGVSSEIVDVIKGAKQCVLGNYRGKFEDYNGEGKWWIYAQDNGVDGFEYVDIDASEYGQTKYNEGYEQGKSEGGSCNLEDKWVSPSMNDRDGNGVIVIEESEGFDGLDRVVINPSTIYNEGYNKALTDVDKPLIELYVTENGEYLPQRTITEEIQYLSMDGDDVFSLNVGCGLIEEFIEYTLKFRWNGFVTDDTISNIFGSEESDWDDTAFVIREYGGNFDVKIGSFHQMFRSDNEWHTLKMGATENNETIYIEFDGERYEAIVEDTNFVRWPETAYIGATNTGGAYFRNCKIDVQWIEYVGSNGKGRWTPIDGGFAVEFNGGFSENTDNLAGGYAVVRNEEVVTTEDALGFSKVVVDVPQNGGGDCNIQPQKVVELDGEFMGIYPDEGYNGIFETLVDAGKKAEEWREEGRYDVRRKLQSIEITENGRYSVDDSELVNYIEFDGNSYFDTNIPFGENTKIEVAITKITYEEDEQIIGIANFNLTDAETYGGFGIVAGAGLTYGVFGKAKTHNTPFSYEAEQILTLDRNGLNSSLYGGNNWIDESGLVYDGLYGQTIGIGKIKSVSDGWIYRGLNGRIRYVKIWTDGNDDSTLVTFIPKNMEQGGFGLVNSDGIEYTNISNLGEGTTTFISEWERKYGEGWREINVNIIPAKDIYKETTYAWLMYNGQDTSDALSSNFEIKLRDNTTISDVAPGYPGSSYHKQGPLLICGSLDENQITEINNLVYDAYNSTHPNPDTINYCPVIYFGEMYCGNVQKISNDAFKHMDELYVVGPMTNLGESFMGEMIINLENCEHLFKYKVAYAAEDFIKSLYDFSKGPNKNGVTTSYLKLYGKFGRHDNFKDWVAERGWTLIESEE